MSDIRILVVEDNALVRGMVKAMLEDQGWSVEVAEHGLAGQQKLESHEPFDLVVLDNYMPFVDGIELLGRLRRMQHRAGMPVVMLTTSDCELAARRLGVDVFLRKPEDVLLLVESVERLVGDGALAVRQ